MEAIVAEKRRELIEVVSEVDDKLAEAFLNDEPISPADLEVCQGTGDLFNSFFLLIESVLDTAHLVYLLHLKNGRENSMPAFTSI